MKSMRRTRSPYSFSHFAPFAASYILLLLSIGAHTAGAIVSPDENDFRITTVFLVRHAEKASAPPADPPLSEPGRKRSQELGRVLSKAGIKAIYTSQYLRTKQTAEPLADMLGIASAVLEIRMSASNPREISRESMKAMAAKVYERPGESVLIVGHSNTIPEVIKELGGDAVPVIDENEYDDLFVVTVYAKGKAKVARLKYGERRM